MPKRKYVHSRTRTANRRGDLSPRGFIRPQLHVRLDRALLDRRRRSFDCLRAYRLECPRRAMSLSFWFLVLAAKNTKVAKGGVGISSRDVREVREVLEAAFAATTKTESVTNRAFARLNRFRSLAA